MPAISVIVPIYKVEPYIEKCIQSIVNQTFEDFEIIIIDDHSPDYSAQMAKKILESQSRIPYRIISKPRNEGLSAARNTGVDHAEGQYLLFIDSDDWIDKEMLKNLFQSAKTAIADVVISRIRQIYEDTNKFEILKSEKPSTVTGEVALMKLFQGKFFAHVCKMLFLRSLFQNIKFPVGIVYEDVLTVPYLLANAKKVHFHDRAYYNYLQRSGSITKSFNPDINRICEHLEKIRSDFSYLKTKKHQKALIRYIYLAHLTLVEQAAILSPNYEKARSVLLTCRGSIRLNRIAHQFCSRPSRSMLSLLLLKISPRQLYKRYN